MDLGGAPPIVARQANVPLIAVERWREAKGSLVKAFEFRRPDDRIEFIMTLLEHEREVEHHAMIMVEQEKVTVRLSTHGVDRVTELDKEFARYLDLVFKDITRRPDEPEL